MLILLLGVMVAIGMFSAIIGLTPDERWNTRFNPTGPTPHGLGTVIGVVLALVIGAC